MNAVPWILLLIAVALALLSQCCALDTEPLHWDRPDPCCELRGGTCAWLGDYVVPICCDWYVAYECTKEPDENRKP